MVSAYLLWSKRSQNAKDSFQIVIEGIGNGMYTAVLSSVSFALFVRDDGLIILDAVYTNIYGQLVVAVFGGTIYENVGTVDNCTVGIYTTLMCGVLLANMKHHNVAKLHISSGKETLYMTGAFHIVK